MRARAAGFSSSAASDSAPSRCSQLCERWRPSIRSRRRSRIITPKAKRVIFLFMAGAPSHLEMFDYKPQLAKFDGTLPPADLAEGLSRGVHQSELEAARAEVQVRKARPVRRGAVRTACRTLPASSTTSRSSSRMVDRRVQSCAGPVPDEHRLAAVRPAEHGCLGHLRPGQRVAGSARVRRVQLRQERTERRQLVLGQRISCRPCIRACSSVERRSGAVPCRIRTASTRNSSATRSTSSVS